MLSACACATETAAPSAAVSDFTRETAPTMYRHKYSGRDFATLPGTRESGKPVAILSQATEGDSPRSGRWRDALEPMDMPYELVGLVRHQERVWAN
jgi:hypothetical protein